MTKIGRDQSDQCVQAVWPVWAFVANLAQPTGLTGPSRVWVQLEIFIDLDLVIRFLAGHVHPPYKYKGPQPIEASNWSKNTTIHYFSIFYCLCFYLQTLALPTLLSDVFLRLHDVWRCPSWPAKPMATLRVPTLMGSLPGECSSDFAVLPRRPVPLTGLTAPRRTHCTEILLALHNCWCFLWSIEYGFRKCTELPL